jgi:hypothetical protein
VTSEKWRAIYWCPPLDADALFEFHQRFVAEQFDEDCVGYVFL